MRRFLLSTIILFVLSNLLFAGRYYDAATGRFLQVDPKASLAPDITPYNYTHNNPLNRVDPDGNRDMTVEEYKIVQPILQKADDKWAKHIVNNAKTGVNSESIKNRNIMSVEGIQQIEVRGYNFVEGLKAVGGVFLPVVDFGNVDNTQVEMSDAGKQNIIVHAQKGMDKTITNVIDGNMTAENIYVNSDGKLELRANLNSQEVFQIQYLNSKGEIVTQQNLTRDQYQERLNRLNELINNEDDEKN